MFKTTSLTVDATYLESLLSSVSVKSVRSVNIQANILTLTLRGEIEKKKLYPKKQRLYCTDKEVEMEMQRNLGKTMFSKTHFLSVRV